MLNEIKKLMVYRSGAVLVFFFVVLKCVTIWIQGYDSYYTIDIYEDSYKNYMELYCGELNQEKKDAIQKEYDEVNHAKQKLMILKQQVADGEIDEKTYKNEYKRYYLKEQNKDVFTTVYAKYKYALKSPKEHYILDTRGWETILNHDSEDLILVVFIIIITTLIYCTEYEDNMDIIMLTCNVGKYKSGWYKFLLNSVFAAVMSGIFFVIRFWYLMKTVGISHGSYPLKSISFYENSAYDISLGKAAVFVMILRMFGAVFLAVVLSLLALWLKRKVSVLIVGSAIILLPAIILNGNSVLYRIPFPIGALKATGYLWGNKYAYRFNENLENVKYCTFHAISKINLFVILGIELFLILVLALVFIKVYSHTSLHFLGRRNKRGNLAKNFVLIFFVCCIGFTGCSGRTVDSSFTFSSSNRNEDWNYKDSKIHFDEEQMNLMIQQNGEEIRITRSIEDSETPILSYCVYGDDCYYMRLTMDNVCKIYKISLVDFGEKLVYSSKRENIENFYGLKEEKIANSDWYGDIIKEYSYFFATDRYFYIVENRSLRRVSRTLKGSKIVIKDLSDNADLYYYNGVIYYTSMKGTVNQFSESTNKISEMEVDSLDEVINKVHKQR